MKTKSIVAIILLSVLTLGCSSTKRVGVENPELNAMMDDKSFNIVVRSAEPQLTRTMSQVMNSGVMPPGNSMTRIDVAGQGYFIKIAGDSVTARLPYYGERQMGAGYDADPGINFNGIPKKFDIIKDETKKSYALNFTINSGVETYAVSTMVGNNASSTTTITSSQRNRIRYTGRLEKL